MSQVYIISQRTTGELANIHKSKQKHDVAVRIGNFIGLQLRENVNITRIVQQFYKR